MDVSTEGRVRPCPCSRRELLSSSGMLWSFSLACTLGKPRFAMNLAETLNSVP